MATQNKKRPDFFDDWDPRFRCCFLCCVTPIINQETRVAGSRAKMGGAKK
jgi:hypothetical protein